MDGKLDEATGRMTELCRKIVQVNVKYTRIIDRVSSLRRFFRSLLDRLLACSVRIRPGVGRYRRLQRRPSSPSPLFSEVLEATASGEDGNCRHRGGGGGDCEMTTEDCDLVTLKISLFGDCRTGKTSFAIKYVGDEQNQTCLEMKGLNLMAKTLFVQGARIAFRIWDVGGDNGSLDHVPLACKDAVAILFMFDLTSRSTLQSVIEWYNQARKWNKLDRQQEGGA
ncbi:hypothetical protein Dimus_019117 [Dionaea muscipula]